ncbi:MAG: cache domain-containing protein, partial [Alkalispirochaeta sp.]
MGRFFRLRKYYYELVGSMLVVTLLPLSFVTAVLFDRTQDTVEKQLQSAHLRYLNQTVRSLELVKEQIDSSFKQLILDGTIAQYETYPDGALLETASRTATTRDNHVVSAYLEMKSRIFNKINDLRLSNGFIASVYYYDPRNGIVLTDNWEQYDLVDFYDAQGLTLAQEATERNFEWIPRVAARKYGEARRVLSVRLPSLVEGFVFLVNLHADRIYDRIVRDEGFGVRSEVFAFDRHGEPVLYDADGEVPPERVRRRLREADPPWSLVEEDALITLVDSSTLGWTFVGRTDLGSLYRTIATLRRTFLIVTAVVLVLVITAITAVSRAVYRPVGKLLDYVAGGSSP